MAFSLNQIVPWGRNLEEYRRMFSLIEDELSLRILGCADGPASANAELRQQRVDYVSLDPIYQFSAQQIEKRIEEVTPAIAEQLTANQADYCWDYYQSIDQLVQIRQTAMNTFLDDFEQSGNSSRYVNGAFPNLPFINDQFDLVLCSHCLFSYSERLNESFHRQAILEMSRVGKEVRIFPLLEINGQASRHLTAVLDWLKEENLPYKITTVDYEFQKGGNQMLTIKLS